MISSCTYTKARAGLLRVSFLWQNDLFVGRKSRLHIAPALAGLFAPVAFPNEAGTVEAADVKATTGTLVVTIVEAAEPSETPTVALASAADAD